MIKEYVSVSFCSQDFPFLTVKQFLYKRWFGLISIIKEKWHIIAHKVYTDFFFAVVYLVCTKHNPLENNGKND